MKDKQIIEAMAELDGIKGTIHPEGGFFVNGPFTGVLPDYLNSHNAVQRLIDGFDNHEVINYQTRLREVCIDEPFTWICQATPRHKCEAILKAKGLWVGEKR